MRRSLVSWWAPTCRPSLAGEAGWRSDSTGGEIRPPLRHGGCGAAAGSAPPRHRVAALRQLLHDARKGAAGREGCVRVRLARHARAARAAVHGDEPGHVLKEKCGGPPRGQQPNQLAVELAAQVEQAGLAAAVGEGLAREAGGEQVEGGQVGGVHAGDVARTGLSACRPVRAVRPAGGAVELGLREGPDQPPRRATEEEARPRESSSAAKTQRPPSGSSPSRKPPMPAKTSAKVKASGGPGRGASGGSARPNSASHRRTPE
mmetsp:Transcript_23118/g.76692  ORF Transcript_23118/g.76692 Transcript_23118/m.76692 type:complete len:261 (-) Transcript_23118:354-1136(-)